MKNIDENALKTYFEYQSFLGIDYSYKGTSTELGPILSIEELELVSAARDFGFSSFLKRIGEKETK